MMDYEDSIRKMAGKGNPFRVPDGYFDGFAQRVLSGLPCEEPVADATCRATARTVAMPRRRGLRAALCAAACLCAVVFGASVYLAKLSPSGDAAKPAAPSAYAQSSEADTYAEEIADYAMMDNSDIYVYLASNE